MTNNNLSLWNDNPVKKSIIEFVEKVTKEGSADFIPSEDRIATFDNDGTLWTEQPLQVEFFYALDRIKVLAEENPMLKDTQPFKAFLERDMQTIKTFTKADIVKFIMTTHDGKTPADFQKLVKEWFDTAVHPHFKFSFYDCAFKPQLELLKYLGDNGFKVFIFSAGETDFMRTVTERIYGLDRNRVYGSTIQVELQMSGKDVEIIRTQQLINFNDRDQKPINIHAQVGKRPVFAFGNSDGDLRMLQYALSNKYPSMGLILHHDDNVREIAYDRDFKISPLAEALDNAKEYGITIVSMKNDWKEVF